MESILYVLSLIVFAYWFFIKRKKVIADVRRILMI